jgi:hypothetical protein
VSKVRPAIADTEFANLLSRVVDHKERVILYDEQGAAVAALVPIEAVQPEGEREVTAERSDTPGGPKRRRKARLQVADVVAAAQSLLRERTETLPPWEAVKADPEWQQRWNDLLASVRSNIPSDLSPEEIEADIREACEEVREERLATGPS